MAFAHKLFTSLQNYSDPNTRIGELNRIWYDSINNVFRIQLDKTTPGGTIIGGGSESISYTPSTVLTKTDNYTIRETDTWIINNKPESALILTFPTAAAWTGRSITVKNLQTQLVNSASSNIVPIDSATAGTTILLGVIGNWATLVSDGSNWIIMQSASNNNLLTE